MDSQTDASTPIDVYQLITDQITDLFDHGIIPWQIPWKSAGVSANLLSKRQYRGINVWLLLARNYEQNLFVTFDQLKSIGGSVNVDEKGHMVANWKQAQNKTGDGQSDKQISLRTLGYYKVFNIVQCRDIPLHLLSGEDTAKAVVDSIASCQNILNNMPDMPAIVFQGKQLAHYNIEKDEIVLPKMKSFKTSEIYYRTVFHELIHAVGAQKRLHRKSVINAVPFGTESHTMEALIAEMGCALLCGISGIPPCKTTSNVAAVNPWREVFTKDTHFITKAAGHAQKAVDYILNQQQAESKEEANETEESVVR